MRGKGAEQAYAPWNDQVPHIGKKVHQLEHETYHVWSIQSPFHFLMSKQKLKSKWLEPSKCWKVGPHDLRYEYLSIWLYIHTSYASVWWLRKTKIWSVQITLLDSCIITMKRERYLWFWSIFYRAGIIWSMQAILWFLNAQITTQS